MKKLMAVLVSVMMGLWLAGCSDAGSESSPGADVSGGFVNETIMPDVVDEDDEEEAETENGISIRQDVFIKEAVIYDKDDIKITATELSYERWYAEIDFLIENNSDKNLSFSSGSVFYNCNSVNGYMIDGGYLRSEVNAGKKAICSLSLYYDELLLCGISEIADIEISFEIMDDAYNTVYTEPAQIKTSAYDSYDYAENTYQKFVSENKWTDALEYSVNYFSDEILYEKDGIRAVSAAMVKDGDGNDILLLELENNSEKNIYAGTGDISVNGLIIYNGGWRDYFICAGKRCILPLDYTIMMDKSLWDVYGIDEVGSARFSLEIYDADTDELIGSEEISINISDNDTSFDTSGDEVYNKNDLRIISKKAVDDNSEYSDNIYICLLAENNGTEDIAVRSVSDSFSANGYMINSSYLSETVPAGRSAVMIINIWDWNTDLDKMGISSADDIEDYEITLRITNEQYEEIDKAAVSVQFEK